MFFMVFNVFTACKTDRLDVDVSDVKIEPVRFKRLDKDIFLLKADNIANKTKEYQNKYHSFYNRYISAIINHGGVVDSLYSQSLLKFIEDKDMRAVHADLQKSYSDNDIALLEEGLTESVKRYRYFFPNRKVPAQFVTFMSGFNYNVVYVDSTLGIGLEMYLGEGYKYYSALQLPKFKTRTMNKEHLLTDVVRGWMITEFDNADPVNNLLNHMIFYGKTFYLCDALLPQVHDSLKIGYSTAQMNYCREYEKNVWGFMIKDNKLYENDLKTIAEFTNDGPFTASISKECPPRIAMWIGWQIVRSYMEHNEEVTLEQLMAEKDAQKILSKSKYKP